MPTVKLIALAPAAAGHIQFGLHLQSLFLKCRAWVMMAGGVFDRNASNYVTRRAEKQKT
jgi:hypothetical protein